MIPKLNSASNLDNLYLAFLDKLRASAYQGDICADFASRLSLATDNSIYQVLPQAVLFPKSHDDIVAIASLANQSQFHKVVLAPRGGGTGTNGQSLSDGIVVDLSKHMNNILEINAEERWVRVQTGVVKDQLNAALKPYGLFFAPELSTSNRATIGGMINTDASGQGSCSYGKTRDHVLQLHTVLMEGSTLVSYPVNQEEFEVLASNQDRSGQAHRLLSSLYREHQQAIEENFPKLNRCLTGYDLKHIYDSQGQFNLNNILCGSEGTLGFITEAKLNVLPIPKHSALVVVKYDNFESSLRDASELMKTSPTSIETIDSKVLNLAMNDFVWHKVEQFFDEEEKHHVKGINFVEYTSDYETDLKQKVDALVQQISGTEGEHSNAHRVGYAVANGREQVNNIWAMRKQAVGLLGNSEGEARPIPFVEDTAVPPENLADFIMAFRDILDSYQLQYGMFGHVDAGVLHVRPAIDMKDPASEKIAWEISDKVAELCKQYKGLLWGEHGKGVRSQYAPLFFGELYTQLQRVKQVFDPYNQLNPGKIATPEQNIALLNIDEVPTRGQFDRKINPSSWQSFPEAVYCNGNGACFNWNAADVMCPSWKGTRNRIHSPKGRATLFRQWLKLLSEHNISVTKALANKTTAKETLFNFPKKLVNTLSPKEKAQDFNREVYGAMAGCLSCKSCAGQCPISIDVPEFKSRFLALYYTRYLRPAKDYLVGSLEFMIPAMANVPFLYNAFMRFRPSQWFLQKAVGFVDGPLLTGQRLAKLNIDGKPLLQATPENINKLSEAEKQSSVVIVQDAFTSYFETQLVIDTVKLLRNLGFKPMLAPFLANGKPLHVHGFLGQFAKVATKNARMLNGIAEKGLPLIGIDPSMTYVYRAEYKTFVEQQTPPPVALMQDWLYAQLSNKNLSAATGAKNHYQLLPHCIESSHATSSLLTWPKLFSLFGQTLDIQKVGCCGMSGTYGHEKRNLQTSKKIYALSWKEPVENNAPASLLATGYSCRSQIKRESNVNVQHPVQALLSLMETSSS